MRGALLSGRNAEICDGVVQELQSDLLLCWLALSPALLPPGRQVCIQVAIPETIHFLQSSTITESQVSSPRTLPCLLKVLANTASANRLYSRL